MLSWSNIFMILKKSLIRPKMHEEIKTYMDKLDEEFSLADQ